MFSVIFGKRSNVLLLSLHLHIVCGDIDLLAFLEGRGSHNYEVHMTNLVLFLLLLSVTINCADIWLRAHH